MADDLETNGGSDAAVKRKVNFNTLSAVFFILLSGVLFLLIPTQIDKPLIVIAGSQANMPAELFPQLVATAFLILGVWFFMKSFSLQQSNDLLALDKEAITNVTATLIMMAIYVPLMVNLGFVVGSAIMVMAMSTYFGNRNFWLSGLVSIFLPMAMFFMFRRLLLVELPPFPIDIYPLTNWSLI